jgi:hypothetical protein
VKFTDIDNFYREWEVDDLPWDAVSPVPIGEEHPELLEQGLVDAIASRALDGSPSSSAKNAAIAFLYMYMTLAHSGQRSVHFVKFGFSSCLTMSML